FVVAGTLKALDVEGFARDITLHRITGPAISAVLARVLVPFEVTIGAAAIVGYRRRLALILLIASLALFTGARAWAWAHGNGEGGGCFGRFASRAPFEVIVEDLLLIGAGAVGWILDDSGSRRPASRAEDAAADPEPRMGAGELTRERVRTPAR